MGVKCFMLEETDQIKRSLRRYAAFDMPDTERVCTAESNHGYHQTIVFIDVVIEPRDEERILRGHGPDVPHDDPRWQNTCPCGYVFKETDEWQIFTDCMYKRSDNGELVALREAPAGAMWYATWMPKDMHWDNKTDDSLMCRLPDGHDWNIDGRCNNCALPNDRTHRCWSRVGEPPNVTAGKIGTNCPAGGGSIQSPNWHGFLKNGELVLA